MTDHGASGRDAADLPPRIDIQRAFEGAQEVAPATERKHDIPFTRPLLPAHDPMAQGHERYQKTFVEMPPAPLVVVDRLIPADVCGWVGQGGVGKSSLLLYLMIHVVLGRPVFGQKVWRSGPCVYVSAEDRITEVRRRIRQLSDALMLSDADRHKVARDLIVEDWTGLNIRLVDADHGGNLGPSRASDEFIDRYVPVRPRLIAFDPTNLFGPGESRFVNDGEAALMVVGRAMSKKLDHAAVVYVHHVAKAVAREGIVDQYAGRSGSAFADNSRGQIQLVPHERAKTDKVHKPPIAITNTAIDENRVIQLHVTKHTAGPRLARPIWIVRDGWSFEHFESDMAGSGGPSRDEQQLNKNMHVLWNHLNDHNGRLYSKSSLATEQPGGISRRNVERAIEMMKTSGHLREVDLSKDQVRGRRQTTLACGSRPPFLEPLEPKAQHQGEAATNLPEVAE